MTGQTPADEEHSVHSALSGLFGHDSLYVVLWTAPLLAAAALTPFITRLMGVAEYGVVASVYAVMQVLFVLAGMGLQTAVQRYFPLPDGEQNGRKLLSLSLLIAALLAIVVDSTGAWWSEWLGFSSYGGALRIAVWWAMFSGVTSCGLALLRSQDRLLPFSLVTLAQSIVAEVIAFSFIIFIAPTANMFLLGQLIAQILAVGLVLVFTPPRLIRLEDLRFVRGALGYALPLVPADLSTFAMAASNRLVVLAEMGTEQVARYQIAYTIGLMPTLLLSVLNGAWMPRFFSIEDEKHRAAVFAASRDAVYRLLTPVLIGFAFGSPLMLAIWAPQSYDTRALLLVTSLIAVTTLPYAGGTAAVRSLLTAGDTASIAVATAMAAGMNIALNLVLVPRWGLNGSAAATCIAYCSWTLMLNFRARQVFPVPRPSNRIRIQVVVTAALTVIFGNLPADHVFLVVRVVGTLVMLAWFSWSFRKMSTRRELEEVAP